MARPRVFITLGRTGQPYDVATFCASRKRLSYKFARLIREVVERGGAVSNSEKVHNGTGPRPGRKRSIRDRLERYSDDSLVSSKRQRPDGAKYGSADNGLDDRWLSGNDLRWKLWRRRSAKQNQLREGKKEYLRRNLSKSGQPSASNNLLQLRPEAKESFLLGYNPPPQDANHVDQVDTMGNLKSSWTLNGLGARPSDAPLKTLRRLTPPRNHGGPQLAPDAAKPFMSNDVFNVSKPIGFPHIAIDSNAEKAMPMRQLAPMGGIVEKRSQVEEPLTVSGLLHSLGLGKYEIIFRAEEVDMMALKQMGDKDLKDIGIPMGPRKKILLALLPRSKLQQPSQGRNMN